MKGIREGETNNGIYWDLSLISLTLLLVYEMYVIMAVSQKALIKSYRENKTHNQH